MSGQIGLPLQAPPSDEQAETTTQARWGSKASPASVAKLVQVAHQSLQAKLPAMWIEGELSGLRRPSSGHLYFILKDEGAQLPVAMWRSAASKVRFNLKDGQKLRIYGKVGIYAAQGKFQCYAEKIEEAGVGDMMAQLQALKRKLAAEGLFDPARKRPIPAWPRTVGVVTSATGAAFQDILKVIGGRCPTRVLLCHAQVQGDRAPASIVAAIARMSARTDVDLLIVGRGGGSMEDLWCFNDESVAREIARCSIPVISAVGHEIDTTLADAVADLRAATPSHAGELAVPNATESIRRLSLLTRQLTRAIEHKMVDSRADLDRHTHRLVGQGRAILQPRKDALRRHEHQLTSLMQRMVPQRRQALASLHARLLELHPRKRMDEQRRQLLALTHRLQSAQRTRSQRSSTRFQQLVASLQALSPLKVLSRGYALARDESGQVVRDAALLQMDQSLTLALHRGSATVKVTKLDQGPTHD